MLKADAPRKIIHVDMDCFYAAVETKYRPELRGKPVGVGGPPQTRSVLCTANYEARQFNVRAATPSSLAVRLCPDLILIPPNFSLYKKESRAVREIFERFTKKIEPLSLDEAFLDVTDSPHHLGSATLIAQEIRSTIKKELNLTASAGIAPNKFLAKVASDWNKPDGQFVIKPDQIERFMKDLNIERIYGVGKVTAKKMHDLGLKTCLDIQNQPLKQMIKWFGTRGIELKDLALGIDTRPVESHWERKSLTVEETFNQDLKTLAECLEQLPILYADWSLRMQSNEKSDYQKRISGIVVKVKYFDFKSTTHEMGCKKWPSVAEFSALLKNIWQRRPEPIRLIGLGARIAPSTKNVSSDDSTQLVFKV